MNIYIPTGLVIFLELEKNFQKLATFPRYPGGSGLSAYAGFFYWWCRFPRGSRDSGSTVAPRPTLPPCAQEKKKTKELPVQLKARRSEMGERERLKSGTYQYLSV